MSGHYVIRYTPTEEQKVEALGSIFYEIQQLCYAAQLDHNAQPVKNALLESALVHVRVLIDFFEKRKRSTFKADGRPTENDDVLAADYGFPATPLNIAQRYRERLNKDLVHCSYSRNRRRLPEAKTWPVRDLALPLLERSIEFIDSLQEEVLKRVSMIPTTEWRQLRNDIDALVSSGMTSNSNQGMHPSAAKGAAAGDAPSR